MIYYNCTYVMANIFSNLSKKLFGFSGGADNGVIGIDFSAGAIKVVQIRKDKNSPVLQTYGELSLGPYVDKPVGEAVKPSPETLGSALEDILKEAKVTTSAAGVSIPLSASLINIIDLPPISDDNKLKEVVPIEARKYLPVDPEEVLMDWDIINKADSHEDNPPRALVVAIHKEAIERYQQALESSDLDVSFFEIEIFSTIRSTLDRGIEPILVVDLGAESTKVYIIEHGVVRGSHNINQGGQDITKSVASSLDVDFETAEKIKREKGLNGEGEDAETVQKNAHKVLDHLFSRTREIVVDYQKKNNKVVNEAVLTGGGSILKGVEELASEELDAEVNRADPFSKLQTPKFLNETLTEIGPEFAVAIGAALRRLRE